MENSDIVLATSVKQFLREIGFDEREAVAKCLREELLTADGEQPLPGRPGYFYRFLSLGYLAVFRLLQPEQSRRMARSRRPQAFVVALRPLNELI